MHIDDELRRALRPVDPGPEFTARVLAAVAANRDGLAVEETDRATDARSGSGGGFVGRRARVWVWSALAASLVGAVVGARWVEDRRETARAIQARADLIQALRLTSAKLNVARDVVHREP